MPPRSEGRSPKPDVASGCFQQRFVVRLHARLFVQAVDIGVREIEVQLLAGTALAKPAHCGGHGFDLLIVVHRTDVHVGLHPLKGATGRHRGGGYGCRPVFVRAMWFARMGDVIVGYFPLCNKKVGYILSGFLLSQWPENLLLKLSGLRKAAKSNHFGLDSFVNICLF